MFKLLKYKWEKTTIIVMAIVTAVVLILAFLVNLYWSPILAFEVKEIVFKSSDSLYTADFSSAELHVLRGTIVIFNITLKPDTAVYKQAKERTPGA
ncbi:MAG TPA: hypothetical protein DCO83_13795 [Mucilaginibacter sp.]|nr:hypothetical protein [Mucilaginibacter sp.]